MERGELLVNKIRCPDGTVLESRYTHDYKEHTQSDGRTYLVDGGISYQRIGFSDEQFENLSLYTNDNHEDIRNNFLWTRNYDKEGFTLSAPEDILLKDLEDDHLENLCVFTKEDYPVKINNLFWKEIEYRKGVK